ncbi:hypothetical protein [Streptomyces olivaceoviridis]|uniref:hypothetical protein n=1 Tax=Streptomyces olivaceoviridis TaxID=1921 RepID=UPI003795D1B9
MSMPPPPQNPGPYGQQPPQQPGPYGGQPPQAPGPYGSPYPQQPYPQQQPYPAQQPYPQQQPYPGWGVPPMAPPPKKRRIGLVLGIVGGVVAAVVVLLLALGMVAESGFPAAEHKLTLPGKLLDGTYALVDDLSGSEGKKISEEADEAWDAKDIHGVVGTYSPGGDETKGTLVVSGMYGRFKNAEEARKNMMKGAGEGDSATIAVPAKEFELDGVTISCEVMTEEQLGTKITVPVCAWADGNTGATVAEVATAAMDQDPSDVDLEAFARKTLTVRSEMRKPIG